MNIKIKKNTIHGFTLLLCFFIIANFTSHIFRYATNNVNCITLVNNICWVIFIIYSVYECFTRKAFLTKRSIFIFLVLIISTLIGRIIGQKYFPLIINYKSAVFVFLLSFYCCLCVKWSISFNVEEVCFILKLVVIMGIAAVIFAFIYQHDLLINVIKGVNTAKSSWNYYSFFSQRNIYAEYCLISLACCLILHEITKNKMYIFLGLLFAFNIYITDSRTSLYSCIFMLILYFYIKSRHKILLVILGLTVILMFYVTYFYNYDFTIISSHYDATSGMDSGLLRFNMWKRGLDVLYKNNALLQGFGDGAASEFLMQYYAFGSFHNAYMDILFEGGIVRLVLFISSIAFNILLIIRGNSPIKDSYISFILTFCLVYFFESGASVYLNNYFALTTTILIILLPRISCLTRGGEFSE